MSLMNIEPDVLFFVEFSNVNINDCVKENVKDSSVNDWYSLSLTIILILRLKNCSRLNPLTAKEPEFTLKIDKCF